MFPIGGVPLLIPNTGYQLSGASAHSHILIVLLLKDVLPTEAFYNISIDLNRSQYQNVAESLDMTQSISLHGIIRNVIYMVSMPDQLRLRFPTAVYYSGNRRVILSLKVSSMITRYL